MTRIFAKDVRYDRETRDFAMFLDGELVGWARTEDEAWRTLDDLVYETLSREARLMPIVAEQLVEAAAEPQPEIPTADQVAAACKASAEEYRDGAAAHREQGNAVAAKGLEAAARAADKAAFFALDGEKVARWSGDDLLVKSATDQKVYRVTAAGCPCKAGENQRACWHAELRYGHERALDAIDQEPLPGGLALAA